MKMTRSQKKLAGQVITRKMTAWKIKIRRLDATATRWIDEGWKLVFSEGVEIYTENKDVPFGQFKDCHDWWYFFHEYYMKKHPDGSVQMHDMLPATYDQDIKLNRNHPWVKEVL